MDQSRHQWRKLAALPAVSTEEVLERYYRQLVDWGTLLTRGDRNKAQDLVHDFCLHLTVTKPDLNGIANLDGYLYKCLRHIYLSGLVRSSREALQFVNIAEFDSIQLALAPRPANDPLPRQNDLRRICCYAVWRKNQTKSASYFILRFFHGYHHQEIAGLAGTPIAAIYTKFRTFRVEVRSYLEESGKLQFITGDVPPVPALRWTPVASIDLFKELRQTILDARIGVCVPEDQLIALYRSERPQALSCSLLSHIVSCERCLAVIDSHLERPTLGDREPLDEVADISGNAGSEGGKPGAAYSNKLLRSVQRHGAEILEHRPRTLSIAVDGRILASHDVRSQSNVLSARVERPENASFVEVFSELGIRLALLSIGDLPPQGPHEQSQRVVLSDERWLNLSLSFDGLGLSCKVVYFDPALVTDVMEEDDQAVSPRAFCHPEARPNDTASALLWPEASHVFVAIRRFLHSVAPSPVIAWSVIVAGILLGAGYLAYRSEKTTPALNASELLNRCIQIEAADLKGQTEHQVVRFEEATVDGGVLRRGTIDLWKDGDGKRFMRRLYDVENRLIAAEWMNSAGDRGEYPSTRDRKQALAGRELLASNLWKQDLSASAFRELAGQDTQIRAIEDGYELTAAQPADPHPRFAFATLVLDRRFHAVREMVGIGGGVDVREVRFVQVDYERRPTSSVPDVIFDPRDQGLVSRAGPHPTVSKIPTDVRLAELHIAVLYQLGSLGADTSEPIEVQETPDKRILVAGTVANDARKQEILAHLSLLENQQLLGIRIISPTDAPGQSKRRQRSVIDTPDTYDVSRAEAPANAYLREHFQKQGLMGRERDAAVLELSHDVLAHAQRALQHASALNHLGTAVPISELRSVSFTSRQQWTELIAKHGTALEGELRTLQDQLSQLSPINKQLTGVGQPDVAIENPEQYALAANQLLLETQNLNRAVGNLFASTQSPDVEPIEVEFLVSTIRRAIPLRLAVEIRDVAARLATSARTTQMSKHSGPPKGQIQSHSNK